MTRVISLLLLLLVALGIVLWLHEGADRRQQEAAALNSSMETWREYVSPQGEFRVLLPSFPRHAKESIHDPKTRELKEYEVFLSGKDNGTLYSINLITLPANETPISDDKYLEKVVTEMLSSNPKNTIKTFKQSNSSEGKAVDFSVESENVTINGRAFLEGKTLYVLSTTSPQSEQFNPQEFEFFLNSFHSTPRTK